jgi:hypothetical protein
MTRPQLVLTRNESNFRVIDSYYTAFNSDDLWNRVSDKSTYLFIRAPMMFELARRSDRRILDLCEKLLASRDIEEWFVGLRTMTYVRSNIACERLMELYKGSPPHRRRYIAKYVGMVVEEKYRTEFRKIALSLSACGSFDVTGWTNVAMSCLKSSCKRLGIDIVNAKSCIEIERQRDGNNDPLPFIDSEEITS